MTGATIDRLDTPTVATKVERQHIGRKISVQIVKQALNCASLKAQIKKMKKKKKPLFLAKNIKAYLEFAKSHHH